jgi:FkbM family methyltransferase
MNSSITSNKLPNGFNIVSPKKDRFQFYDETKFLYDEVKDYFKHGISCNEGDTIFDIGANIGLFAMHAYNKYNKNIKIYCFEPIPETFKALSLNIQYLNTRNIKAFPLGISSESRIETFSYHPNSPGLSSMYPNNSKEYRELMRNNILENLKDAPQHIRWLISMLPQSLRIYFVDRDINKMFAAQKVECQLEKLSTIIKEHSIQEISLLKIDVERSELDVLMGVDPQGWSKIKQIVMEVHDINNQLNTIKRLLKDNGFSKIIVDQAPFFKDSENFNLYALK